MEKEKTLSPGESLQLIASIIAQTKENVKQHSFIFLLWGWLLAIASILRFILQSAIGFRYYFIPFPVMAGAGLIITIYYFNRTRKTKTETYLNFFISRLRMVLAAGFIVAVFVSVYQKIEPFTYTLILAGVGTFLSGLVMKFKPFLFGGICFLFASVCCVFVADEYKVLIHGIAIIFGYIIPGYLLKNSKE